MERFPARTKGTLSSTIAPPCPLRDRRRIHGSQDDFRNQKGGERQEPRSRTGLSLPPGQPDQERHEQERFLGPDGQERDRRRPLILPARYRIHRSEPAKNHQEVVGVVDAVTLGGVGARGQREIDRASQQACERRCPQRRERDEHQCRARQRDGLHNHVDDMRIRSCGELDTADEPRSRDPPLEGKRPAAGQDVVVLIQRGVTKRPAGDVIGRVEEHVLRVDGERREGDDGGDQQHAELTGHAGAPATDFGEAAARTGTSNARNTV